MGGLFLSKMKNKNTIWTRLNHIKGGWNLFPLELPLVPTQPNIPVLISSALLSQESIVRIQVLKSEKKKQTKKNYMAAERYQ